MHKQRSIKVNMALNAIKGLLSVVFPLITFPYITRRLGVTNVGRYNFAHSIISYFVLLAGLGINTFAIREGAKKREDSRELNSFASEMLTINLLSTVISYVFLIIIMLIVPSLYSYKALLIILSLQILFKTIGVEWLYSIYEDYLYITIRSILFQIVSLILLFVFVKNESDLNIYTIITVISSVGSNVLNLIHSRKYCRFQIRITNRVKNYIKPIFVLFAMSATVTIYVSSDITILGFLCNDEVVGIYSVSVKVYTIVKTILSSIIIVSIPRLSASIGKKDFALFNSTAEDIYNTLITIVMPSVVGIITLRKEIILIISSENYLSAESSLSLLSIALFLCLGAWFWGQCILIPFNRETTVFKITILCAVINIVSNFMLIFLWQENAAAFTTIIAEACSFIVCRHYGKEYVKLNNTKIIFGKVSIGCIIIPIVSIALKAVTNNTVLIVLFTILISIVLYTIVEVLLKNNTITSLFNTLLKRKNIQNISRK